MTPRWALKRTLKWAVEWGMVLSGCGRLYRSTSNFQTGFRILTYHQVSEHPQNSYGVKTSHFQSHMAYLSDHCPVVGLPELVRGLTQGPSPQPGAVAVTFDDGYKEAIDTLGEILDRYRIPATFFVVTEILDSGTTVALPSVPFMTWNDVRALASAGFSIGSHTVSHRSLGEISADEVEQELRDSRDRIAEEIGSPPEGLAYPYGTMRDISAPIAEMAENVGYRHAVTAIHGLNHIGSNPFLLRRTSLTAGDGLRTFRMILKGHLDPWVLVDKWGYRFQRSRRS